VLDKLPGRHLSWAETVRERIAFVAPDDDINYTIVGMMLLEEHGVDFTRDHVRQMWYRHLPFHACWGPERLMLIRVGMAGLNDEPDYDLWAGFLNPSDEMCGALIRADAYGYACAGNPELAARLAWQDASFSHRRTGIYGTMFVAAAIATAPIAGEWSEIFETALKFIPQKSRLHEIAADSLAEVRAAGDWLDGYDRIHRKYGQWRHCKIYQEVGTLMNTLRFARDAGEGICMQVSQGNDTDSFGCTAGSILGAFHGPGSLEDRWLAPFHDRIEVGMGWFYEHSLSALAKRMARLPALVAKGRAAKKEG
jgi:ADP-ribosylglycohydrolase